MVSRNQQRVDRRAAGRGHLCDRRRRHPLFGHQRVLGSLRNSVLVGHTQPQKGETGYQTYNAFAADISPFNVDSGLKCASLTSSEIPDYCLNANEGVSLPLSGFFNNERLENIYDGPSYRNSNAYLDVTVSSCPADGYNGKGGCIYGSNKTSETPQQKSRRRDARLLPAERGDRLEAAERLFLSAGVPRQQSLFRQCRYPPLCDRPAVQGV